MVTKMYILVEADQPVHADPLSRLMTQLADQLKNRPHEIQDAHVLSTHDNGYALRTPNYSTETDRSTTNGLQVARLHSSLDNRRDIIEPKSLSEHILGPDVSNNTRLVVAEACVDSSGRAKAKVSVCNNEQSKDESILKEEAKDVYTCGRRNGLDPTPGELRGLRKFEYLPKKSKIPEYKGGCANVKSIAISDHLSSASTASKYSGYGSRRNSGMKEAVCPRNIPEARLNKYRACASRKNGLQDKCDAHSKESSDKGARKQLGSSSRVKAIRARPKRLCVNKPLEEADANSPKKVNSRELRAGVVYTDCDCYRRNGLQHDCPRNRCGGSKDKCLTEPWPECDLGKYYREKWSRYDALRSREREPAYCVPLEYDLTRRYVEK
ncbi:hypothetical protein TSAR_004055 [Trichomalopsis sarcophagae]|uniref:Uncharacterized protein n=1 Tax=Trichomalopsis sarcophagae TaxID=543379 RepID=A0A232FN77_9HYME|nr:hypothetical protein TSAR_004055 [Trichomalopsis sarcophagae]